MGDPEIFEHPLLGGCILPELSVQICILVDAPVKYILSCILYMNWCLLFCKLSFPNTHCHHHPAPHSVQDLNSPTRD